MLSLFLIISHFLSQCKRPSAVFPSSQPGTVISLFHAQKFAMFWYKFPLFSNHWHCSLQHVIRDWKWSIPCHPVFPQLEICRWQVANIILDQSDQQLWEAWIFSSHILSFYQWEDAFHFLWCGGQQVNDMEAPPPQSVEESGAKQISWLERMLKTFCRYYKNYHSKANIEKGLLLRLGSKSIVWFMFIYICVGL